MNDFRAMVKSEGHFPRRRTAIDPGGLGRRTRSALPVTAALVVVALLGCRSRESPSSTSQSTRGGAEPAAPKSAPVLGDRAGPRPSSSAAASPPRTACQAPSLTPRLPIDGRDSAALERCHDLRTGAGQASARCGMGEAAPSVDWRRLDAAVLHLDEATRAHVCAVASRGRALGRQGRAFGLVGDSMTVSGAFLRPFSASRQGAFELAPEAKRRLSTSVPGRSGGTIIDYYRGVDAQRVRGSWTDSFGAPRAAKVGARSSWALVGDRDHPSPLALMVRGLSPAAAVAVFGGNDAAFRVAAPEQIAEAFEIDLGRVIDALEQRGVVPILSTIARHGAAPGLPACRAERGEPTNWRLAVQTNAVSAAAARLACRRHLPLVDLRHALDAAPDHGLGTDGVHPSDYVGGAGMLTAKGLQCGYNIRNYVTLRMLKTVKELLESEGCLPSESKAP